MLRPNEKYVDQFTPAFLADALSDVIDLASLTNAPSTVVMRPGWPLYTTMSPARQYMPTASADGRPWHPEFEALYAACERLFPRVELRPGVEDWWDTRVGGPLTLDAVWLRDDENLRIIGKAIGYPSSRCLASVPIFMPKGTMP